MTALRAGGDTHVGQLREINQDSMHIGDVFYVVADGMGGHQGGEVASKIAVDTLAGSYAGRSADQLVDAVTQANDSVFDASTSDPALAGMGTTVVAAALVTADTPDGGTEERIAVVNVGDSRAYVLRGGELEQITDDHSLVGEMVRDGQLTPEEASHHPRRNVVTRALGISPDVDVDEFQLLPSTGDRYLLCTDGLFGEIDESQIARVLRRADDPGDAAAELVRLANDAGGRDNITALVFDVVDDGGRAEHASAVVAASTRSRPGRSGEEPSDDGASTATSTATPTAARARTETATAHDQDARQAADTSVGWRTVAWVVVVLAVVGVGFVIVALYARNTYYVGVEDQRVAIFRGRPGGVLWFDPTLERLTEIELSDVPQELRADLRRGDDRGSLSSAESFVDNLAERIERTSPPVTTTTADPTTTTTATPTSPPVTEPLQDGLPTSPTSGTVATPTP